MIRRFYLYSLFIAGCVFLFTASAMFFYGVIITIPKNTKTIHSYASDSVVTSNFKTQTYNFEPSLENSSINNHVRILLVGDMMFQYPLDQMVLHQGASPFDYVHDYFQTFDIAMGSLETNIAPNHIGAPQLKPYRFRAPLEAVDRLKKVGFEVVSVANNHTMDYGPEAFATQLELLNRAGILTVGGGRNLDEAFSPRYIEINNTKIAFIAVNAIESDFQNVTPQRAGTAYFDEGILRDAIFKAKTNADFVIIYAHWGSEHVAEPTQFQKMWARFFIDSGADVVVGSHPHIRQKSEIYNGKPIFYSLGNFVYTGMGWSEESLYGSMLEVIVINGELATTNLRTVKMTYHGYPDPLDF